MYPSRTALLIALLLCPPQALRAQVLAGRLADEATGAPIAGAFVQLMGADGVRQAAVLTDATGRYRLRVRAPGGYRLQAEQLGFQTATTPLLDVGSAGLSHDFTLRAQALVLPEVHAHADERRCERRPDGAAVHDLWTAIRGALAVTAWANREGTLHFSTLNYVRELDAGRRSIRSEALTRGEGRASQAYRAVNAAYLAREGYLLEEDNQLLLLGLDADVLLSDEFLDTHCFRLVAGRDPSMIGLGFEPLRRDGRVDVNGVLWVERDSARLSHVEYEFENLPRHLRSFGAEGEVRFRRLPGGMWIVESWVIRTPHVTRRGSAYELTGFREDGGAVTAVRRANDSPAAVGAVGVVQGVVRDSIGGGGLRGARVFLSGTGYATEADAEGRFRLDNVPVGQYGLSFMHPELSALKIPMPLDSVVVTEGSPVQRTLTTASMRTILKTICPGETQERTEGLIYGSVLRDGSPVAELAVTASWVGPAPSGSGPAADRTRTAYTRHDGIYVLCWLPTDREVLLRTKTGAAARVHPSGRAIVRRDFD